MRRGRLYTTRQWLLWNAWWGGCLRWTRFPWHL